MSNKTNITCQSCGANISLTGTTGTCEYCGSSVRIPDEKKSAGPGTEIRFKPKITKKREDDDKEYEYHLALTGRGIKSLDQVISLFSDNELATVTHLDLSDNHLEKLNGINKFTSLKELRLDGNRLSTIDTLPRYLKVLSVRNNRLKEFISYADFGIDELYIGNNGYESLPALPRQLRVLGASGNAIENIESLAEYSRLSEIRLEGNKLRTIPKLPDKAYEITVDLRKNVIEYLDDVSISNLNACLWTKQYTLLLTGNPLNDYSSFRQVRVRPLQDDLRPDRRFWLYVDREDEAVISAGFVKEESLTENLKKNGHMGVWMELYPDRKPAPKAVTAGNARSSSIFNGIARLFR